MHFYPAIDIKDGQFIRLEKGQLDTLTIYGNDPVTQAKKFCEEGAKWIHIVDIDGAFEGVSKNMDVILRIKKSVTSKIQVGGGIRKFKTIKRLLDNNIDRVVLGTVALTDPTFVKKVCEKFPGKIAIGLDTKNEFVATEGWAKESKINFEDFLKLYENTSISCIIFTDIEKDGLLAGTNFEQLKKLLSLTKLNIIASGGVAGLEDLSKLKKIKNKNLIGVISGKAIYEKKFSVNEAIEILEE